MDLIEEKIRQILLEHASPYVESHGGKVEYSSFQDGILTIRLFGACSSCSASTITVKALIDRAVRRAVPEVKRTILAE